MKMKNKTITRRKFLGTAAAGAAAFAVIPVISSCSSGSGKKKPNSRVAGVQLGCTTYSYRNMPHKVDEVIEYLLLAGINQIERRSVAEEDLGLPQVQQRPRGSLSDKEKADFAKAADEAREKQRQWRLTLPMSRYEDMRNKFNNAGIKVNIAKFAPSSWTDEEIDYAYTAAKVLGSIGITDEYSESAIQRLGKFAEKHKSLAMYHTHQQPAEPGFSFDSIFKYSPANYLNLDAGHYFGATGLHQ